jgi:hypothetical protein
MSNFIWTKAINYRLDICFRDEICVFASVYMKHASFSDTLVVLFFLLSAQPETPPMLSNIACFKLR